MWAKRPRTHHFLYHIFVNFLTPWDPWRWVYLKKWYRIRMCADLIWRIYVKRCNSHGHFKCIKSTKLHLEVVIKVLLSCALANLSYFRLTCTNSFHCGMLTLRFLCHDPYFLDPTVRIYLFGIFIYLFIYLSFFWNHKTLFLT